MKKLCTFRLPETTRQQLVTLSKKLGLSKARVIAVAVHQFFDREEKP